MFVAEYFIKRVCESTATDDCMRMDAVYRYKNRKQLEISFLRLFFVIRLGLEPKTPTLKVLCSTN